jgi:hypothetical protein
MAPTEQKTPSDNKPVVLIIELLKGESSNTNNAMIERLSNNYDVITMSSFDPENNFFSEKHIDLVVITPHTKEALTDAQLIMRGASVACPEAKIIIFATAPPSPRVYKIIPRNKAYYDMLANVIRKKFPTND